MDKQFEKLNKLLDIFEADNDSVSAEDFASIVDEIIVAVNVVQNTFNRRMEALDVLRLDGDKEVVDTAKLLTKKLEKEIREFKEATDTSFAKLQENISSYPSLDQIIEKLAPLFKKDPPVLDTPDQIRDKLQKLEGDDRLDKSAIKGLEEELLELRNTKFRQVSAGSGGNNGRLVQVYDLSSLLDGVTKTFPLPALQYIISVQSNSSPIAFRPSVDYTNTQQSITFTSEITASSTLAAGQTVIVIYMEP